MNMNTEQQTTTEELDGINLTPNEHEFAIIENLVKADAGDASLFEQAKKDADALAQPKGAEPPKADGDTKKPEGNDGTPPAPNAEEQGTKTAPDDGKGKTAEETDDSKLSSYEKAKRREARAWEKINEEKAKIAAERQEVERQKAAALRMAAEISSRAKQQETQELTPEQYETAAAAYEREGKYDTAEVLREQAKRLRENPPRQQVQQQQQAVTPPTVNPEEQRRWLSQAVAEIPQIGVKDSPLNVAFRNAIQAEPAIMQHPKGPYYLAKLIAAQAEAGRVPSLTEENKSLKAEIEKLKKQVSLPEGGIPAAPAGAKRVEDMTADELETVIRGRLLAA